jgi:O-acetyl-ADP-ribose deacetylase (regulator of RNase III)
MEIEIVEGDITEAEADAIVNAANTHLWMGGGVAGAIRRKGGDEIEREAVAQGPIEVGGAVVTGAGRLRSRYVIHAATMGPDLCTDGEKIYRATLSALREAAALGLETVAFPALGTGVGGFGYAQAAQVMLKAIQEHASKYTHPEKVVLVLFGQEAYRAFRQEWERMRGKDG